jgi:hypothetical protein
MTKHMDRIYTYQDLQNIQTFIYSLKRKAKSLDVNLVIDSTRKEVIMIEGDENDTESAGYFDTPKGKGKLGLGTKRPINEWLPVLVHESCHMDQWSEGLPIWKETENMRYNIFGDFLKGKRCILKEAHKCMDILKKVEIDCEIRSIEKIKKYKLPINIKEYIQKANAYIFSYNWMKKTRRWVDSDSLYKPEVLEIIDTEFYNSYDETPKKIESMFKKYKV